jgi:hypothetical protein
MTAKEIIRNQIIEKIQLAAACFKTDEIFSKADCELISGWWQLRAESRVTPKLCEAFAAIDDPDRLVRALTKFAINLSEELVAELQENVAASARPGVDGVPSVDLGKFRLWLRHSTDRGTLQ